jgi:hypothetical protein
MAASSCLVFLLGAEGFGYRIVVDNQIKGSGALVRIGRLPRARRTNDENDPGVGPSPPFAALLSVRPTDVAGFAGGPEVAQVVARATIGSRDDMVYFGRPAFAARATNLTAVAVALQCLVAD